ncbi:PTS glucitol/sorbitol transporter subunit IIB [Enterococcus hulanensis]|uniref:PTS glucitol/sorbitol transporter subunit IIB n=1 Tax=Enterococcus hulanensis TaxID=2559929 RepID=UPI001A8D79D1|nr:PTS glucitol/sorbitol transporter subunit IIB [Enterococcus hulanensis]MBO0455866.1 PTS glucitol/sorbitol transporter subunit IIB [Enterococcus hulanensis]
MMKSVIINHGPNGWGGPLKVFPTETQKYVVSVTGGGIHPLAQKIADLLDVPTKDGFKEKIEPEEIIIVIVDCGGTLRCGVYPKLGVKTIDVHPISPSGPLSKFMTEDIFVSGTSLDDVTVSENIEVDSSGEPATTISEVERPVEEPPQSEVNKKKGLMDIVTSLGKTIGKVVNIFYQGGRESIDIVIKNILPFMTFVSIMVGIINYTGVGNMIANAVKPLAGNLGGLLVLSVICAIPILSPILGPGAVIAQVVGVLIGVEIGKGTIPPSYALPALFAINSQVVCDFIPVGLTLCEATPETVEIGTPAVLFTRLVTGPIAVIVAWLLSFGLY